MPHIRRDRLRRVVSGPSPRRIGVTGLRRLSVGGGWEPLHLALSSFSGTVERNEPRGEPLEAINRSAGEHDPRRGDPVTRLSLAFLVLVLANYGARAAEKSYRLGDLEPTAASAEITRNTIVPELAKLGFQEGTNLVIDERVGDATAMPGLAQDLILSRPDAIIAFGTDAILAAHKASTTIPIVTFGPDPVTLGLAASVARPGGHVTRRCRFTF